MPVYRERMEQLRRLIRFQEMAGLVWGPGDPGAEADAQARKPYEKRLQIKQKLREILPQSAIHFSEDPEMVELTAGIAGLLEQEEVQASLADFIVVLAISPGAQAELAHFLPTFPWSREKLYIFMPEQYVNAPSFVNSAIYKRLAPEHIIGYTPQEFEDCSLVSNKVVQIADTVAMKLFLRLLGGI